MDPPLNGPIMQPDAANPCFVYCMTWLSFHSGYADDAQEKEETEVRGFLPEKEVG